MAQVFAITIPPDNTLVTSEVLVTPPLPSILEVRETKIDKIEGRG